MSDIITKYFPQITAQQQAQFNALYNLYAEWNAKINVISRKDITNLCTSKSVIYILYTLI